MKTDYSAHEGIYQKKQAKGQAGWDPADVSKEVWEQFAAQMKHPALPATGSLLELGCGAGNLSVGFAGLGYDVTGVDISPTAIKWATQRATEMDLSIDFLTGNVLALSELEDEHFQVVVDSHCFHCIIGPDRDRFLANAKRLLVPGGIFVLNSMIQNDRTTNLDGFDPATGIVWRGDIATRSIGTQASIEEELEQGGFVCVESRVEMADELADTLLLIAQKPSQTNP